jgi:hypothetical protein
MFMVAETHDLDKAAGCVRGAPVGSYLLEDFEVVAAETDESLAKSAQDPGVLGTLVSRDDVTVGLQKHSLSPLEWISAVAFFG